MGQGTLEDVWDGWETFPEVQDGLGDPHGGLGQVGRSSGRSGTGLRTLPEVRDWSRTGRGTLEEVWDGLGDPPGDPGQVVEF